MKISYLIIAVLSSGIVTSCASKKQIKNTKETIKEVRKDTKEYVSKAVKSIKEHAVKILNDDDILADIEKKHPVSKEKKRVSYLPVLENHYGGTMYFTSWREERVCLWNMAERIYGNPRRWPELYEANREMIGDDPDLIPAHTYYNIP